MICLTILQCSPLWHCSQAVLPHHCHLMCLLNLMGNAIPGELSNILVNFFCQWWIREYLPLLQQGQKWITSARNLQTDYLVLYADEHSKRGCWPIAIVEEKYQDSDGAGAKNNGWHDSWPIHTWCTQTVSTRSEQMNDLRDRCICIEHQHVVRWTASFSSSFQ